jgi:GT2 family glycosyltransferase
VSPRPAISIIVPVHNAGQFLHTSLAPLLNASVHDYELIVVDDASNDRSAAIAREFTTRVICVQRRAGAAAARNVGAAAARGEYLVFLDADVRIQADTVDRLVNVLIEEPHVGAVFGSYDAAPTCPGIVSQFRNLLHHAIHQASREEAVTFWAGCGAIRRELFIRAGGFDERFSRSSVEDIELGYRLRAAGERIVLAKEAQVTHLKPWTLWSMVACDFASRGVPWTRLLLQKRFLPNDLNLKYIHRASVLWIYLSMFALVAAGTTAGWIWVALVLIGIILLAADKWTARRPEGARHCGWFAAATGVVWVLMCIDGWRCGGTTLLGVGLLQAIAAANLPFYVRLAHYRGTAFTVLAVPLHLLHYGTCGAALIAGSALHCWDVIRGAIPDDNRAPAPLIGAGRGSSQPSSAIVNVETQVS